MPMNSERGVPLGESSELDTSWLVVCQLADILPGTGVAALVEGEQVAILRTRDGASLYALSNFDPFSKAFVIARGIIGDRGGVPKIASPIFKQNFDLRTGRCLDDPNVQLTTYPVRERAGVVEIGVVKPRSS
jgi:nitrite reductase (NADH) small subunit